MIKPWFSARLLLAPLFTCGMIVQLAAEQVDWGRYRHPVFGYEIDIPYTIFPPVGDDRDRLVFERPDGQSRLTIYGEDNVDRLPLSEIARELEASPLVSKVTYRKLGKSWVVLSGHLTPAGAAEQIFYLKLMMSADRQRYAVFAINYPRSEKTRFDTIVDRLEASFRPPT